MSGLLNSADFITTVRTLEQYFAKLSDSRNEWFIDQFDKNNEIELVCRRETFFKRFCSTESKNSSYDTMAATIPTKTDEEIVIVEYRIGYSHSYQVPILLLRIQTPDGVLLPHEDFWNFIDNSNMNCLSENSIQLSALSQIEHPHLGIPFYQFHPCKTAKLMSEVLHAKPTVQNYYSLKYMILWLSLIANPLGLKIPCSITTLCKM